MRFRNYPGQMSDSALVMIPLTLSGGLQDAYSYFMRDRVFANAQTGNIVLMSHALFSGNYGGCLRYLIPVLAFSLGVLAADLIRALRPGGGRVHWRQLVLAGEIALLGAVGLLPAGRSGLANALTSFSCAMQVQSFRKLNGNVYATTMCIGNLRAATELWCSYRSTGDRELRQKSLLYYGFIGIFIVGAALGGILTGILAEKAIWISSVLLLAVFAMMFQKEDIL